MADPIGFNIDDLLNPSGQFGGLNFQSSPIPSGNASAFDAISALDGLGGAGNILPFSPNGAGSTALTNAVNTGGGGGGLQQLLLGGKDSAGALGLGFDFLSGLSNYKLLSDQLDLAEDQFKFSKNFSNRNLQNQAKTVNTQLEDRQSARLGSTGDTATSGTGYESLGTYLDKNRISEKPVR